VEKKYLQQALAAMEPKGKAARLRELLPVIEQKISEGVSLRAILGVLNQGGIELTESTLKSYLYRARKKQANATGDRKGSNSPELGAAAQQSTEHPRQDSVATDAISPLLLEKVMKPDPVQEAEEFAHYETIAKHQRRSTRS
jgi:hypothetical protein